MGYLLVTFHLKKICEGEYHQKIINAIFKVTIGFKTVQIPSFDEAVGYFQIPPSLRFVMSFQKAANFNPRFIS